MRLWPSVSQITRETTREDRLGSSLVPAGTQLLILNSFNHRDPERVANADHFDPARWLQGTPDYTFNHFSNGPQGCAGQDLVLFIAKSVLALLLRGGRYTVVKPALSPDVPLPHAFNHFRVEFSVRDMPAGGA
jgi:cytochrome P450